MGSGTGNRTVDSLFENDWMSFIYTSHSVPTMLESGLYTPSYFMVHIRLGVINMKQLLLNQIKASVSLLKIYSSRCEKMILLKIYWINANSCFASEIISFRCCWNRSLSYGMKLQHVLRCVCVWCVKPAIKHADCLNCELNVSTALTITHWTLVTF